MLRPATVETPSNGLRGSRIRDGGCGAWTRRGTYRAAQRRWISDGVCDDRLQSKRKAERICCTNAWGGGVRSGGLRERRQGLKNARWDKRPRKSEMQQIISCWNSRTIDDRDLLCAIWVKFQPPHSPHRCNDQPHVPDRRRKQVNMKERRQDNKLYRDIYRFDCNALLVFAIVTL